MKKSRIVGYALTLAATLFVGSAMGQVNGSANYVDLKKADGTVTTDNSANAEEFSLVQIGKAYKFYAKPDPAYHPSYNAGGSWVTTADFTWTWTLPATNYDQANASTNYVEITAKAGAVTATVSVTENAPLAWGLSCKTSRDFKIVPFPVPTFAAMKAADGSVVATNADAFKRFCATADGNAIVKFSLASSGTPHVKYKVEKADGTIAADGKITAGTFTGVSSKTNSFTGFQWNYDATTGVAPATMATAAAKDVDAQVTLKTALSIPSNTLAEYELGIQFRYPAPVVADKAITVYRISLLSSNGLISRKGDYKADGTMGTELYYDATGAEGAESSDQFVDFYIVKAPTTGPVYHIGNNVAK